mgnify:CR=1 FL=1
MLYVVILLGVREGRGAKVWRECLAPRHKCQQRAARDMGCKRTATAMAAADGTHEVDHIVAKRLQKLHDDLKAGQSDDTLAR